MINDTKSIRYSSAGDSNIRETVDEKVKIQLREILEIMREKESSANAAEERVRIISEVTTDNCTIQGTYNDFQKLIDYLSQIGDNACALKICLYRLKDAPSYDLLASTIEQSRKLGPTCYRYGQACIDRAKQTDHSRWSRRLYDQCIEFLLQKAVEDPLNAPAVWEDAEQLARNCQRVYQKYEDGFYLLAKLKCKQNQEKDAIDALRNAIFEKTMSDLPQSRMCPKCCVFLLGLMDDPTEPMVIKRIADIGLRYGHPWKDRFYLVYRKACAMDQLLWADRDMSERNPERWLDEAEKVIAMFDEAYDAYRNTYGQLSLTHEEDNRDFPIRDYIDLIKKKVLKYDHVGWQYSRPHWKTWMKKYG